MAALIPFLVLVGWFSYVWFISGVLSSEEKDPATGRVTARGYVKRVGWDEYRRHGHWVTFHANGQKASEGTYRLGEKVGEWKYWDDEGHESSTGPSSEREGVRVP